MKRADRNMKRIIIALAAVTGYGQDNDRTRSQAAGFEYHLVKPVDLHVLEDVLARKT